MIPTPMLAKLLSNKVVLGKPGTEISTSTSGERRSNCNNRICAFADNIELGSVILTRHTSVVDWL